MSNRTFVPSEIIQSKIYLIREQKVMLDKDLAGLYGVLTKNLNKAVRRNLERFPSDFMIELTKEEYRSLRFQIGTLKTGQHSKYPPLAFTEQGIAMLSTVLNSKQAIQVNIQIMRVFIKLKEIIFSHKDLALKIKQLEGRVGRHDREIRAVFEAIKRLISAPNEAYKKTKIGFIVNS